MAGLGGDVMAGRVGAAEELVDPAFYRGSNESAG